MTIHTFIGMGSNIDPETNIRRAASLLRTLYPHIRFSSAYRTAPRDKEDQADFFNAVACMDTQEFPEQIQESLLGMEQELGKGTNVRFGPRIIDLDLLVFGERVHDDPALTIPHPRMHERRFVLEPLLELQPLITHHPRLKTSWNELLDRVMDQRVDRLTSIVL